jgi:hypothetical protein
VFAGSGVEFGGDVVENAGALARDFSSLTASEPLQGIDASRISVLNVSGVANGPYYVGRVEISPD